MVNYEGIFFDDEEVKKIKEHESKDLGNIHERIHITFMYKPDNEHIYDELLNREISVYLISYGSSENNSGFQVELPEDVMQFYTNYDMEGNFVPPHLTASISDNGKAKDTRNLEFKPLEEKVKITGRFGYWIKEEDGNEYLSFEPQKKQSVTI